MRRLFLLMLLAGPMDGGVIYHFVTTSETRHGVQTTSGRVWSQGDKYRLELDPSPLPRAYDIAISHDADVTATHISVSKRTISDRPRTRLTRSSLLFQLPGGQGMVKGRPRVTHRTAGPAVIAGRRTTRHVISIDYKLFHEIDGVPVRANVRCEVVVWADGELPELPFRRSVKTGFPHVDRETDRLFAAIPGMILRNDMTVTRTIENGPPQREHVSTVVDEIELAEIAAERFEIPLF